MLQFDAPEHLDILFTALTLVVVCADIALVGAVAPKGKRRLWAALGLGAAALWMGSHGAIATSGILEGQGLPPPPLVFFFVNAGVALLVAFSALGRQLASAPLWALILLQNFRLPLEMLLHALYEAGVLPVQITWSGYNFDVLTGASAIVVAALIAWGRAPRWLALVWNVMGFGLLLVVVTIAVTSAPTPFRQFTNEPPVLLPFVLPYNWIVGVHVWTALVGHLVIFRALFTQRGPLKQG